MEQQGLINYQVSTDGRQVTEFTVLPTTPCVVDGVRYQLTRDKSKWFEMVGPLGRVAVAHATTATNVLVDSPPHQLVLRREGKLLARKRWDLHHDGQVRGSCRMTAFGATGDLPGDLPLSLRVFLFYVAIMSQKAGPAMWT
jgi:hypothetical protein